MALETRRVATTTHEALENEQRSLGLSRKQARASRKQARAANALVELQQQPVLAVKPGLARPSAQPWTPGTSITSRSYLAPFPGDESKLMIVKEVENVGVAPAIVTEAIQSQNPQYLGATARVDIGKIPISGYATNGIILQPSLLVVGVQQTVSFTAIYDIAAHAALPCDSLSARLASWRDLLAATSYEQGVAVTVTLRYSDTRSTRRFVATLTCGTRYEPPTETGVPPFLRLAPQDVRFEQHRLASGAGD